MQRTYSTCLKALPEHTDVSLEKLCALFGQVSRHYYNDNYIRGANRNDIKKSYQVQFGINARWFNGVRYHVDAQVASAKETRKLRVDALKEKIKRQEQKVNALNVQYKEETAFLASKKLAQETQSQQTKYRFKKTTSKYTLGEFRGRIQQAQGKFIRLKKDLSSLQQDIKDNIVPKLCFGGRGLFSKQHRLSENGYSSHQEWRRDWHEARNNQFFLVGSKDETQGNQNLQAFPVFDDHGNHHGYFRLFLILPIAVTGGTPKKESLGVVKFSKEASKQLLVAMNNKTALSWRVVREAVVTRSGKRARNKSFDQTSSEEKIYDPSQSTPHYFRVHVSFDLPQKEQTSLNSGGAIGLDFNSDHIACCIIDQSGNPVDVKRFDLQTKGKTSTQSKQMCALVVKDIVLWAQNLKLPIVTEQLDFAKKKKELGRNKTSWGKKQSRMLSGLTYTTFFTLLQARCFDQGILCHQVNPAYTSVIGKYNYSKKYGISTHQSAACVIARRHFCFTERPHRVEINHTFTRQVDLGKPVVDFWRGLSKASKRPKSREQSQVPVLKKPPQGQNIDRQDMRKHVSCEQQALSLGKPKETSSHSVDDWLLN